MSMKLSKINAQKIFLVMENVPTYSEDPTQATFNLRIWNSTLDTPIHSYCDA